MPNFTRMDALPYALGAIALGVVCLAFHSFALQWQPVPEALRGNAALAIVSALVLIAGGLLAALRRTQLAGAALLAVWFGLWVVALHVPVVLRTPAAGLVGALLGLAELLAR